MNARISARSKGGAMKSIVIAALAAGGLALAAAGCGGQSTSSGTTGAVSPSAQGISTTPPPEPTSCTTKGGTITVLSAGDVDHIDPGAAYYSFTYEITRPTQRDLLGVKPGTTTLIPDLAASMPTVSADGRTVTVMLKHGVRFSPPVNREVTSADVKYAIERGFSASVANGYAGAYFSVIQGAPKTTPRFPESISGIETPNPFEIVFHLTRPEAIFTSALSLPLTAPVPESYAKPFDDQAVSAYGLHQVATGPYMIKNNSSGSINGVGYQPGKLVELVRNPNWNGSTDYRLGCADQILFKEGYQDPTVMTKTILSDSADANGDTPPPAAELKSILGNAQQKKNLFFTPTGGSRYVALNTRKAPFDKLLVREAVATVLDKNAMRLTRGGAVDGTIATHFIDPSFADQGFNQAGGYGFDPFPSPGGAGDVARAKDLMKQAGYASGLYTGPQVSMVADNTAPGSDTAKVIAADLAKIGFHVKLVSVTHATMYTKFCNVPANEPDICPNVGWLPDFHEPQTILDPTFNGKNILPSNNSNWPLLNDTSINAAMDSAEALLGTTQRYEAWGKIDDQVTQTAAAIPWLWENFPSLFSNRVVPAVMVDNEGAPDVAMMSVK
jgi:peptide/nickel transport system substrate-binding protein